MKMIVILAVSLLLVLPGIFAQSGSTDVFLRVGAGAVATNPGEAFQGITQTLFIGVERRLNPPIALCVGAGYRKIGDLSEGYVINEYSQNPNGWAIRSRHDQLDAFSRLEGELSLAWQPSGKRARVRVGLTVSSILTQRISRMDIITYQEAQRENFSETSSILRLPLRAVDRYSSTAAYDDYNGRPLRPVNLTPHVSIGYDILEGLSVTGRVGQDLFELFQPGAFLGAERRIFTAEIGLYVKL